MIVPSRLIAPKPIEQRYMLDKRIGESEYETLCVTSDGRIIARGMNTGKIYQIDDKFTKIATLHDVGTFTGDSKPILLSTDILLLYNQGKIYRSDDTTYTAFTLVFTFRAGATLLINRGWDKAPNDNVMFGEYSTDAGRTTPATQNVYLGTNDGQTWTVIKTFNRTAQFGGDTDVIRHVHTVCYDSYTGKFWVGTGDGDETESQANDPVQLENRLYKVDIDGTNWELIGTGSQLWRIVGLAFTQDYVLWGTDGKYFGLGVSGNPVAGTPVFCRLRRSDNQLEVISDDLLGTIFGSYNVQLSDINIQIACQSSTNNNPDTTYINVWIYDPAKNRWHIAFKHLRSIDENNYAMIKNIVHVPNTNRLLVSGAIIRDFEVNRARYAFSLDIKKKIVPISDL